MLNNSNAAQSPDSQSDPHRQVSSTPAVRVVPMRRRMRAEFWRGDKVAQLMTLRSAGLCNVDIAVQLGISEACVRVKLTQLRAAGVPIAKYKSGSRKGTKPERQYAATVTPEPETQRQAACRAARLQRYWHARGYPMARFWVDDRGRREDGRVMYTVRSNLVGGLPPGGRRG